MYCVTSEVINRLVVKEINYPLIYHLFRVAAETLDGLISTLDNRVYAPNKEVFKATEAYMVSLNKTDSVERLY